MRRRTPGDANDAGVAFIHQELNLFTNLSIAENIFINGFPRLSWLPMLNRNAMRGKTRQYLDAVDLQVSPDTLVEKLSPGERQLAEIAKALSFNAKLIIFDEPTTSLTARETDRLFTLIEQAAQRWSIDRLHLAHSWRRHAAGGRDCGAA